MRTPALKIFYVQISEIFNSYPHYQFIWEEFERLSNDKISLQPNAFTKDAFPDNSLAANHNILLKDLSRAQNDSNLLILKSLFILSYTYFETYLKNFHALCKAIDPTIRNIDSAKITQPINPKDDILLYKMYNRLRFPAINFLTVQEVDTLNYLRLRRNVMAHDGDSLAPISIDGIQINGTTLNTYWDSRLRSGRQAINFLTHEKDSFSADELIDVFNLFRTISFKIDSSFFLVIRESDFQFFEVQKFLTRHVKGFNVERKRKMFRAYLLSEYGYNIPESTLLALPL